MEWLILWGLILAGIFIWEEMYKRPKKIEQPCQCRHAHSSKQKCRKGA